MEDFFSIIRTDRKREMDYYEGRGYTFIDSAKYLLVDKIKVHTNDKEYSLGVQADAREIYFYYDSYGLELFKRCEELYGLQKNHLAKSWNKMIRGATDSFLTHCDQKFELGVRLSSQATVQ